MLVQNRKQFDAILSQFWDMDAFALDTETTGLFFHLGDEIIGISIAGVMSTNSDYMLSAYFPFRHAAEQLDLFSYQEADNLPIEWMQELQPLLSKESDKKVIFHNYKFDAKMLRKEGIEVEIPFFDVMVMSHYINENGVHSLKGLGAKEFGEEVRIQERRVHKLVKKLGGWDKTAPKQMEPYACKDAELTYWLCREFIPILREKNLMQLWPRAELFLRCLMELEWEGILLDFPLAQKFLFDAQFRIQEIQEQLGFDPGKPDQLAHRLFAVPPAGLGLIPYSLSNTSTYEFPDGRPTMDEEALSKYSNPLVDKVLEYRGLVKANSTWYRGYQEKAGQDGKIHPSYNTSSKENKKRYGTVTGRLTSSEPNIQQMPRDPNTPVRKLLMPRKGYEMWEYDYSQIELRLTACYTNDEIYLEAFNKGEDPHQITAEAMKVTRQTSKHAAYTMMYGGSAQTLKLTLERLELQETGKVIDYPLSEAEKIVNNFYKVHPKIKPFAYRCKATAESKGFVLLWTGKRRNFDPSEPWTFRKAFNSIIQGGAAEIMVDTMLRFYQKRNEVPYRMVLQVHDSLWFEVPTEDHESHADIKKTMEWPGDKFPVPFPVDSKFIRGFRSESAFDPSI